MTVKYIVGDSLEVMRTMADASVDLSTCSPPFLALRNYNDLDGQWGSEPTPADFLRNLLDLAVETRRVLTPHGSLAWELGDSYSGSGGSGGDYNSTGLRAGQNKFSGTAARNGKAVGADTTNKDRFDNRAGWPLAKSLTGVPTLFAWSLAYGRNLLDPTQTFEPWRIRNIIVWARNNPPVGALGDKVRPATSYITVATPSKKRWFDLDAVRGAPSPNTHARTAKGVVSELNTTDGGPPTDYWTDEYDATDLAWLVNGQPSKLAHYAMWAPKLAERLVLSMCPREVCTECGEPRRRITKQVGEYAENRAAARGNKEGNDTREKQGLSRKTGRDVTPYPSRVNADYETIGWSECDCEACYRSGVVLDPFAGTGTTLAVADLHGRDAIGIDLDPANPKLYEARRAEVKKSLYGVKSEMPGTLSLFDQTKEHAQ